MSGEGDEAEALKTGASGRKVETGDWMVLRDGSGNGGGVWAECLGLPVGRLSSTGETRFPG